MDVLVELGTGIFPYYHSLAVCNHYSGGFNLLQVAGPSLITYEPLSCLLDCLMYRALAHEQPRLLILRSCPIVVFL